MPKVSRAAIIGLAIVGVVAVVIWQSAGRKSQPAPAVPPTAAAEEESDPQLAPFPPAATPSNPLAAAPATTSAPPPAAVNPAVAKPTPMTAAQIDQILLAEQLTETEKAKRLLELLPTFPETMQEEVAQHMCNLMPDEDYGLVAPLLTNGIVAEPILDVVMTDLMSRPNALKLPLLLQMARTDQHPRREEALSVLEIYLEKNLGSDWAAWENVMQAYLKENPE